MLWTTMPETAIHEYRKAYFGKNEIGFAKNRHVPSPAGDSIGTEYLDQGKLGILVATGADAGHDL